MIDRIWWASLTKSLAVLLILAATPASAELIVLESNAPGIKAGAILADSRKISLNSGEQLRVIVPSGATKIVRGPFSGKASDLLAGIIPNKGLWATITSILKGKSLASKGAVRNFSTSAAPVSDGFSWTVIPAHAEGNICVDSKSGLRIGRPPIGTIDSIKVIDPEAEKQAIVRWASGSAEVLWPKQVPALAGHGYYFIMSKLPLRQINLQFLDRPLPDQNLALKALHERNCSFQMEAWLRDNLGANFEPPAN